MVKLTYRGIIYKTKPVVDKIPLKADGSLQSSLNNSKSSVVRKLDLYTYRGVSYIKV